MKYVIAFYKNMLSGSDEKVPFGVVVTDGSSLAYDFDTSKGREKQISDISATFDPLIFEHFKDTFTNGFVDKGVAVTTDENGVQRTIPVESEEFLDYLTRNSQGVYQYTHPRTAEAESPEALLSTLIQRL